MGSKKKKGNSSDRGSRNTTARGTKPDMSKYAGATSNKSKRNYGELRLARPDHRKEYASENAPVREGSEERAPRGGASAASAGASSRAAGTGKPAARTTAKKTGAKKNTTSPVSERKKERQAQNAPVPQEPGTSVRQSPKKKKKKPAPAASPAKPKTRAASSTGSVPPTAANPPAPDYEQDEYSKALFGSDFYSSVYNLYDMKHPEKSEGSRTVPVHTGGTTRKKRSSQGKSGRKLSPGRGSDKKSSAQSVAAYAVKNRGTAAKKPHAQVMKNGKARGVVTSRVAHRKLHRRNRRTSMLFNALAVMTVIVFLAAVYVTVFFHVKEIVVKGESPYAASHISDVCVFAKGDNILFIDAPTSEKAIVSQLPYIENCTIKRRLPATVEINVTHANVVGVADTGYRQWGVVSGSGKILETITNLMQVSDSDLAPTLSYAPEYETIRDVAAARNIPVLEGLSVRDHTVGGYLQGEDASHVEGFAQIIQQAEAVGLHLGVLRYGAHGYEAEYEGRVNIVVGDYTDVSVVKRRLEIANYIINVSGDVTEHDRGEITFLKNEAFFNPSYEMAEDPAVQKDSSSHADQKTDDTATPEHGSPEQGSLFQGETDSRLLLEGADALLRGGLAVLPEGDKPVVSPSELSD